MESIFGSELEEFNDTNDPTTTSSPASSSATSSRKPSFDVNVTPTPLSNPLKTSYPPWNDATHTGASPHGDTGTKRTLNIPASKAVETTLSSDILVIQGPCTYVRGKWVHSSRAWTQDDVERALFETASQFGSSFSLRHSNHEGDIVDWLLNAPPTARIVLNWNGA
ncbi:hypothetical protein PINS_up001230 [Pythium insidiosum]|nr:hypothetical protein PINS_up001230 [Pythium insidiosum]